MEFQEETLSFYSPLVSSDQMKQAMITIFYQHIHRMQEKEATFEMELHQQVMLHIDYITIDKETTLFSQQMAHLKNYIAQCSSPHTFIKQNLLYQISLFQSIYVVRLSYPKALRKDTILSLMEVADQLSALIFWENGEISDSYGDIIFNNKGESEVSIFVPKEELHIHDRRYSYTEEQKERILHSQAILAKQGIYAPSCLPVVKEEDMYVFQEKTDILKRAIACYCLSMHCDYLYKFQGDGEIAFEKCEATIQAMKAFPYFTLQEIDFLNNQKPCRQEMEDYYYYHEACMTLLWCVGLLEKLPFVDRKFSYQEANQILINAPSLKQLQKKAQLRSKKSLLHMMDITQRYLWAYQDSQKKGFYPPYDMEIKRAMERLRCLYWISYRSSYTWNACKVEVEKTMRLLDEF